MPTDERVERVLGIVARVELIKGFCHGQKGIVHHVAIAVNAQQTAKLTERGGGSVLGCVRLAHPKYRVIDPGITAVALDKCAKERPRTRVLVGIESLRRRPGNVHQPLPESPPATRPRPIRPFARAH